MDQPDNTANIREIAVRLLLYEAEPGTSEVSAAAAAHVCQKLCHPLGKLVGEAGSRALLARALTLAKGEAKVLTPVRVTENGALEGLSGDAEKASTVLIAHLIGLVVTFLGEALTLRLLHDSWPDRAASDIHFGERNGNEPAKESNN